MVLSKKASPKLGFKRGVPVVLCLARPASSQYSQLLRGSQLPVPIPLENGCQYGPIQRSDRQYELLFGEDLFLNRQFLAHIDPIFGLCQAMLTQLEPGRSHFSSILGQ